MIDSAKRIFALILVPVILFMNGGCETTPEVVSPENGSNGISLSFDQPHNAMFGDFEVVFTGKVFNGTSTTFSYTVSGPGADMHFRLGWPVTDCTAGPISWAPTNGSTGNNDCCINPGLEWHPSVGPDPIVTYYFSYTFAGDIPEGTVPASVKSNSTVVVGEIAGPGVPEYLISGAVFQDANANGALDATETFIMNVSINLLQGGSLVSSMTSDENGHYEFSVPCGSYTVEIDTTTLTGTEKTYFTATTSLSSSVTVGPDSPGNNFGFDVNSTKLLNDLDSKTLTTTGLTAAFWKKEFQFGVAGRTSVYTPAELLAFIDTIEGLALADPFIFPADDQGRLDFVYQILRKPIRSDFDAFERELMAIELNYAAGRGIDLSTELVLIGWGESLYNGGSTNPKNGMTLAGTVVDATEVYRGVNANKSTGGGGTQ